MNAKDRFELLRRLFEEEDIRNKQLELNEEEIGSYASSQLVPLNKGIEKLVQEGFIDTSRWFIDAGFGDLRVALLMAVVYRVPSLGIEYKKQLVDIGSNNLDRVKAMGLLDGIPVSITQGNFTTDKPYEELGVRFEDIVTFFNYWNNFYSIAERISERSPPGTTFILEGTEYSKLFESLKGYKSLKHVRTVVINEDRKPENVDRCLLVYRKAA